LNEVKASSFKIISIKLGLSTSNKMTYVGKVSELVFPELLVTYQ
jgi:hypothetical protein